MIVVGITGSIGCGKTTLAKICNNLGYCVFDADKQVKSIYLQKEFLKNLRINFPDVFIGKKLDKILLRNIVFGDRGKLSVLEGLIHPILKRRLKKYIRNNVKKTDILIIDAALLYETNWNQYCDFIILADVEYEIQKKRVMKRDNISSEEFEKINSKQMSAEIKKKLADIIINTNNKVNVLKKDMVNILRNLETTYND